MPNTQHQNDKYMQLRKSLHVSARDIIQQQIPTAKLPDEAIYASVDKLLMSHIDNFVARLMEDKARMHTLVDHIVKDVESTLQR